MLELAVAILVLLISIFVFLKMRKKKLSATDEQVKTVAQQSKPASESARPEAKIESSVAPSEPEVKKPATTSVQAPSTTLTPPAPSYKNNSIPQDSMLRRHYLTHLQTMIAELNQPCPTDSALIRHHQTLLVTQLEHYLNDEVATQKLTQCYENYKKSSAPALQKPQVILSVPSESETACPANAEHKANGKVSIIPEDSMLKRHYLNMLSAQVAGKLPPRPTDSALRRHYNTMLETEIKKQLGC